MLQSIYALLANYGLDVQDIANAMSSLITTSIDPDTGEKVFGGPLAPLASMPVVGEILELFASFAPVVTTTVESTIA
ncbi:MAG: hypothetical protein GX051_06585 [Clostridiales bacterium]|jgi:hypothetical protein|nr:hypothetical protein [Clostridiales bacterium]